MVLDTHLLNSVVLRQIIGMNMPVKSVEEAWNSAEFFANKILKQYRGSDNNQVDWIKALKVSTAIKIGSRAQSCVSVSYIRFKCAGVDQGQLEELREAVPPHRACMERSRTRRKVV